MKALLVGKVPAAVLALHDRFVRCPGCSSVFWPGSHYQRMLAVLGPALA